MSAQADPRVLNYLAWWAWGVASLGWLYAVLARLWPRLFHAETLRRARPEGDGYRLGRAIYWQLSGRTALSLALLAPLPVVAAAGLPTARAVPALAAATLLWMLIWLSRPPGFRMGIVEHQPTSGEAWFELRGARDLLRALAVMLVAGLLPATGLGAALSWLTDWPGR